MNEFAEKYKDLLKEHEATLRELDRVTESRDMAIKENECLGGRLQHLLESDYIRSFDEYDPRSRTYKRDIKEADAQDVMNEEVKLMAKRMQSDNEMLKNCIVRMTMERLGVS